MEIVESKTLFSTVEVSTLNDLKLNLNQNKNKKSLSLIRSLCLPFYYENLSLGNNKDINVQIALDDIFIVPTKPVYILNGFDDFENTILEFQSFYSGNPYFDFGNFINLSQNHSKINPIYMESVIDKIALQPLEKLSLKEMFLLQLCEKLNNYEWILALHILKSKILLPEFCYNIPKNSVFCILNGDFEWVGKKKSFSMQPKLSCKTKKKKKILYFLDYFFSTPLMKSSVQLNENDKAMFIPINIPPNHTSKPDLHFLNLYLYPITTPSVPIKKNFVLLKINFGQIKIVYKHTKSLKLKFKILEPNPLPYFIHHFIEKIEILNDCHLASVWIYDMYHKID